MRKTYFRLEDEDESLYKNNEDYQLFQLSFTDDPPAPNIKKVTVPGMNGVIDLTDYPAGYPTFGQRTVSWRFFLSPRINEATQENYYRMFVDKYYGRRIAFHRWDIGTYDYFGRLTTIKKTRTGSVLYVDAKATCDPYLIQKASTPTTNTIRGIPGEYSLEKSIAGVYNCLEPAPIYLRCSIPITIRRSVNGTVVEKSFPSHSGATWWTDDFLQVHQGTNILQIRATDGADHDSNNIVWKYQDRRLL